ncbi:hypothetical protein CVT25_000831 [Psilocybe cyanescens]|uniref:Uncharacterized protein n=1 Tax=Psilocybe cyanescens TaxID=93625 RepID=A0A409XS43_PSICY|nr:hypothetical protein CVT25_000831 [Psilocybe cyanescens]
MPQGLKLFSTPWQHAGFGDHKVNDEKLFFQLYHYLPMYSLGLNQRVSRKRRDIASTEEDSTSQKPEENAQPPVNQQGSTSPRALVSTSKAKQEPQIPFIPEVLPSQVEDTLGECPSLRHELGFASFSLER